jgi:hypothetical protein
MPCGSNGITNSSTLGQGHVPADYRLLQLEFFAGLRGTLSVTFEEGTWAAWLYDLLKPHVAKVVVCNPRKNALLKHGNKM